MTPRSPVLEPVVLNQVDTNANGGIPAGNRSDGTASAWSRIWQYQVPDGQALIIASGDLFSVYLEDASAEVGNNTCQVRLVKTDTSRQDAKVIAGAFNYVQVKEFQDKRKMMRLLLPAPVEIMEKQFLMIEVNDDGAIDESDSYFQLRTSRVRQGL